MLPGFKAFDLNSALAFDEFLSGQPLSTDTHLNSTTYLLLTGRHGLWISEANGSYLTVCRHPNLPGEVLVLPPTGNFDPDFAENICAKIHAKGHPVTLGRIQEENWQRLAQYPCLRMEDEEVLDWRYPSVVLDNNAISSMSGSGFSKFRQKVKRIDENRVSVVRVNSKNLEKFRSDAFDLIHQWAASVEQQKQFSFTNLIEPNVYAYEMSKLGLQRFSVDIVYYLDTPIAVYTNELPIVGKTANAISLSIARNIVGASEYAYRITAKSLFDSGCVYTSLNGAETASLDHFRNKLCPVERIKMKTFRYVSK